MSNLIKKQDMSMMSGVKSHSPLWAGGATEGSWGPGGGRGLSPGEGKRGIWLAVSEGGTMVASRGTCVRTVHVPGREGTTTLTQDQMPFL
jgi:hypothetical protein